VDKKKSGPKKPATSLEAKKQNNSDLQVTNGVDGIKTGMTHSQIIAELSTRQMLAPHTIKAYSNLSTEMAETVSVTDLADAIREAGDEVTAGDLGRVERMLTAQAITMDAMFNTLAYRANRQEYIKSMESYLRLALKAQAQCRATAEALALLKNPQPYIKQANIAQGHQQVNNTYAGASGHNDIPASGPALENRPSPVMEDTLRELRAIHRDEQTTGAGESSFEQSKLLKDGL
jgi:hypothetical protein